MLIWASLVAQPVKNPSAKWETWVPFLGWEDPLEKGKATHSSILVWRIPRTVQSMRSQRVRHDWTTFTFTFFPLCYLRFSSQWHLGLLQAGQKNLECLVLFIFTFFLYSTTEPSSGWKIHQDHPSTHPHPHKMRRKWALPQMWWWSWANLCFCFWEFACLLT